MTMLTPLLQFTFSTINPGQMTEIPVNDLLAMAFRFTYIALSLMVIIFAFVVIRQVKVMNDTVNTILGPILRIVSIVFFAFTIFLAFLALTRL